MAKLKQTITQSNNRNNRESELIITVEFNTYDNTVDEIISVKTYNVKRNVFTDVTTIFKQEFEPALESIISNIDWAEIHSEAFALAH